MTERMRKAGMIILALTTVFCVLFAFMATALKGVIVFAIAAVVSAVMFLLYMVSPTVDSK